VLGGWDVTDGGWGGILGAGGILSFSGGYEYIFDDHAAPIILGDSSQYPIGGFISQGNDGAQVGAYIYKSFAKDYVTYGGGFYWDINKLGNYLRGDYWKGTLPVENE